MAIDKDRFKWEITEDFIPLFDCPTCGRGVLVKGNNWVKCNMDSQSEAAWRDIDAFPADLITGTFHGLLRCSNPACNEPVHVLGNMRVDNGLKIIEGKEKESWVEFLAPTVFLPAVPIFKIHEDVPDPIKGKIMDSFKLYWQDEGSCANKIRKVVETIMDDQKVPKTERSKKGKRRMLTLHERIEKFKVINLSAGELLMAIKWIGNEGSHVNEKLTKDNLLDGYDMLDHVTRTLYARDALRLKQLSKKINKGKKPISKKRIRTPRKK